jgi:CRISPR/Cas system-associated endonuclease Cas1
VADTSVTLRRAHFRVTDDLAKCTAISRQIVAGKIQNPRNSLLRAARENQSDPEREQLPTVIDTLGRQVGQKEWARLRDRLLTEIKMEEDSHRFYFLDQKAVARTEHHGVAKPVDLTEPLIL